MIYYGRQDINKADIQAVESVLRSDFLTQGPAIERFERRVADYCGAKYAVAVCNATAALHIACLAAGWERAMSCGRPPSPLLPRRTVHYTVAAMLTLSILMRKPTT